MSLPPLLLDLVYLALLVAASPLLAWRAARHGKYRQGWRARWWGAVPPSPSPQRPVWLHAVSVGEVQALRPLVEALARRRPDLPLAISTTTRAGFGLARKHFPQHTVFYCPLDFSWAVRRALGRLRPRLLVLVELELWPNLIRMAKRHGASVAVVNGRLSLSSFRGYRRLGPLVRPVLAALDAVGAQDAVYAERFDALGVPRSRISITGSIKFDGAQTDRANRRTVELARLAGFGPEDVIFLAGSTQRPEEALAVEAFRALAARHPQLRLVVVPRHPERFDPVARALDASGLPWQRRSRLGHGGSAAPVPRILLVDTVGELDAWWGTAHIGFVGGSMGARGGQNMIEPSAYGVAICFGPQTQNFRDVVQLLHEAEACRVVRSGDDLTQFVADCLEDPALRRRLGERARRVVLAQRGATERTIELLGRLLDAPPPKPHLPLPPSGHLVRERAGQNALGSPPAPPIRA